MNRRLLCDGRMDATTERRNCGLLMIASPVPKSGQRDHSSALWTLMMLEAFLRTSGASTARPPGAAVAV